VSQKPASPSCKSVWCSQWTIFFVFPRVQKEKEQPRKSPAPAQRMHEHSQGRQQRQRGEKQTTARKQRTNARTRRLVEYSARIGECTMDGWPVRGARPSVRAQSRARLPAYTPLTRLLHSCTTWQWLASSTCSPLPYRRDSRAEVTAHRAWPAAWVGRRRRAASREGLRARVFARVVQSDVGER
jgi:hypothetical protein